MYAVRRSIGRAMLVAMVAAPAFADTVSHFGDGPFSDVSTLLDLVGIGSGNVGSETTATSFIVPGASGMVDLTFTFERDTGLFNFAFGFFDVADVTADPVADRVNFAVEAITNGTLIFDDTMVNPGASLQVSVEAGTELGFYIIPNDTVSDFLADPNLYYDPPANSTFGGPRSPLFSMSDANPGEFDQLLSFIGNGVTLFSFEDKTRIPESLSDEDYTDLAFTIDAELRPSNPVPEPSSAFLVAMGLAGVATMRRRAVKF